MSTVPEAHMSTAITRVLAANRGEIARRIFRTCRREGIGCVAVFSDPDAAAPHVAEADAAVRLPGSGKGGKVLPMQVAMSGVPSCVQAS